MMQFYAIHVVEDSRYHRQSAERSQHGPKRSQNIADIPLLRLSIAQESRYRRWEPVKW